MKFCGFDKGRVCGGSRKDLGDHMLARKGLWSCHVFDPIFGETLLSVMFTAMKYGKEEQVMIIT